MVLVNIMASSDLQIQIQFCYLYNCLLNSVLLGKWMSKKSSNLKGANLDPEWRNERRRTVKQWLF